ncbi:OsmC family protein [Oceanobacillus sp. CAU 1775]
MIASIAGCSSSAFKVVMNKMRIEFTDIDISVQIVRNVAEANRIEKMHLHFTVTGENLNKEKIEKAGVIARKNCSMVQSVEKSIDITGTYEIKTRRMKQKALFFY